MSEAIDYELIAEKVADLVSKQPPVSQTMWNSDDCARYFNCSPCHFTDRIATSPTFPEPCRFVEENGRRKGRPNWLAGEVMKWAQKR